MADPADRLSENAPGAFYVDSQCIDCDVCRVTAPANFQRQEDKGYSYVYRQPASPGEIAQCEEAMDSCPVEAIGQDGRPVEADDPVPGGTSALSGGPCGPPDPGR